MSKAGAMDVNREQALRMLAVLRRDFVAELPERCDDMEQLALGLGAGGGSYMELYRRVHSLKGSAGSHGVPVVSAICHNLEDVLSAAGETGAAVCIDDCLHYIDLLRLAAGAAAQEQPDYRAVEETLETLRARALASRRAVLLVEPSPSMVGLCHDALAGLPVSITPLDSGLDALARLLGEKFDLLIAGRTLKDLNGIALIAALRASESVNRDMPVILISADPGLSESAQLEGLSAIVRRDAGLAGNLRSATERALAAIGRK